MKAYCDILTFVLTLFIELSCRQTEKCFICVKIDRTGWQSFEKVYFVSFQNAGVLFLTREERAV